MKNGKNLTIATPVEGGDVVYDFYRPHKRVYYDPYLINPKTGEAFLPERRVKQSFVAECDINTIMKQYSQTGQIQHMSARAAQGAYMDLPDEVDFQTSMSIVQAGEAAFATLPSKVRERFHNSPEAFLQFMADPANQDEAIRLGLSTDNRPPPAPTQPQAPSTPPATPPEPKGS